METVNSSSYTVLVLHGALGAAAEWQHLAAELPGISVVGLDLPGHGASSDDLVNMDMKSLSSFVLDTISHQFHNKNIVLFGHSMGGYIAMQAAKTPVPEIKGVVTFGTKFLWDTPTSEKEAARMVPEIMQDKIPAFCAQLAQLHGETRWKNVVLQTASFLKELGAKNYLSSEKLAEIKVPVKVIQGDSDRVACIEDSVAIYRALPNAQLCILPNTGHTPAQVNTRQLASEVAAFCI